MNRSTDELGAHVSSAGGADRTPARAWEIDAVVLQLFTKTPNQWREPEVSGETAGAFRRERGVHGISTAVSHDSYLINLASPDAALFEKSYQSFRREIERCVALGVEFLVTHPGNATDGNPARGLAQNADAIARAFDEVGGETLVLLETTAGSGKVLGATFEQLAEMIERIPTAQRHRVGVCVDTCHVWAAGYDLRGDYDGVLSRFDDVVGLDRLRLFHLNDSKGDRGSRLDRHVAIGEGTLGDEPFRRLMTDDRFRTTPKILETPKGDDPTMEDRRNLERLRTYRRVSGG